MEIRLTETQMESLAVRTAKSVVQMLRAEERIQPKKKKYVGIKEAADILGMSVYHLRRIKDEFPHIKRGDNQQARIYFDEEELLKSFTKSNII